MLLIRETTYCKPGKVRPMVEKFVAMSALDELMKGYPELIDHGRREIYKLEN